MEKLRQKVRPGRNFLICYNKERVVAKGYPIFILSYILHLKKVENFAQNTIDKLKILRIIKL